MQIYADYLSINREFVSVFSEEVDRAHPDAWKSFIPHDGLYDMLRKLIVSLERARTTDNKSLWVHGAYGTGKTFASFVTKHLLEDPLPEVESYFRMYSFADDLFRRLKSLREKGDTLVVFRSSTGHIDSNRKLLTELQQAVRAALQSQGLSSSATQTLYERTLHKLESQDSAFDWRRVFPKYKAEFPDFGSADQVLNSLRGGVNAPTQSQIALMNRVMNILDNEGFVVLGDPQEIKAWLKEVIDANSLQSLVFIWDEFTDFFRNNPSTSALQELAHATSEIPFYLVLITHLPPENVGVGQSDDHKRLRDRFVLAPYQMQPLTAYQLIKAAVQAKDQHKATWLDMQDNMWHRVRGLRTSLSLEEHREDDLKALIPIHPYAAFLVANISQRFSSSQRTLFRFLKEDAKGSFAQFIAEYPKQDWRWYTADSLWDYFLADPSSEFSEKVRDIVVYSLNRQRECETVEEQRVFKAIMLLLALSNETPGDQRLSPSLDNVRAIFLSTPLQDKILPTVSKLAQKEMIRRLSPGTSKESYIIPTTSVDQNRLDKIKGDLHFRKEAMTQESIGKAFLKEFAGKPTQAEFQRERMEVVSVDELSTRRERVEPPLKPYGMGVIMVLMQTEQEREKALKLTSELATSGKNVIYVVVEPPFGQDRWEQWQTDKAYEISCKELRDLTNEQFHQQRCQDTIKDWLRHVRISKMRAFFQGQEETIYRMDGYFKYFPQIVRRVFEYLPESVSSVQTLYRDRFGETEALFGLGGAAVKRSPYKELVQELIKQGFWHKDIGPTSDGFNKYPAHALSQMKKEVDRRFEGNDQVSLNDIWDALQHPPFGLMPSPIGVFIMGYLLRDYCEGFYWTDGTNFFPLSKERMAECINKVLKGREHITIHRIQPEARAVCSLVAEIFGLAETQCEYPEKAQRALREYLTERMYPIWSLRHLYVSKGLDAPESVSYFEAVLSADKMDSTALNHKYLAEMLPHIRREAESLHDLVSSNGLEDGMKAFFDSNDPELLPLAEQLSCKIGAMMSQLRELMNEEVWLWTEEDVRKRLPELKERLRLNLALNELTGYSEDRTLDKARHRLSRKLGESRLPLEVIAEAAGPEVRDILMRLGGFLSSNTNYFAAANLSQPLIEQKARVRDALNDSIGALICWTQKRLSFGITPEEASLLLGRLAVKPRTLSVPEFELWLKEELGQIKRQQLGEQVRAKWSRLTASESPDDWSQEHRMPIDWMFDGADYGQFFAVMRKLQAASESDLTEALDFMEAHGVEFQELADQQKINSKFLQAVLPQYDGIPIDFLDWSNMREHLLAHVSDVRNWRRQRIAELCQKWVVEQYQEQGYQRIARLVSELPERQLKGFLQQLARDPAIGLKLLKELEAKTS